MDEGAREPSPCPLDAANQLVREDNEHGDYTYVWTYDNAGNILTRKEYAFQTGSLGTLVDTVTYTYGDEDWGDLLTSYDGQNIQYDAMGNPLNDGKWSYEWEHGRQLASMSEVWHPELEITAHPESYAGEAGGTAVFSVAATGDPLSYQWQYSNNGGSAWWSSSMEGSNTASISVQATEARAGNLYRCRISDMNGNTVYSDAAQIDLDGTYPLAILSDPRYYSGNFGETATFAITARGDNITYQWQYSNNGGNAWWNSSITGSATPSMTVQLTEARQNYLYRCKITDAEGNIRYSAAAGFYLPQYTWEFTYNSDGMRTGRTDGLYDFSYVYNGSQLTQMTSYGNTLCFTYDASGKPMTVTLDGTLYYYVTNLQGDIVGILDANGNQVATYTYDAWGNFTVESYDAIASFNPLTYRGYVYDYETGLYYVSSRYYDPEIGRWLNADSLVSTGQGILGCNMFSYCLNNPVNFVDRSGNNAEAVQWWTSTMWWLCGADTVLPVGDIIYGAGILILGVYALTVADEITMPQISLEEENSSVYEYREHTKGARQSTKGKHQKGQTRKNRDNRGEKGDARRYYIGNKKKLKMFFLIVGDLLYEDESTQVVTSGGATSSGFGGGGAHGIFAVHMLY